MRDLLYVIPPQEHSIETLKRIFREHPEIKFVSLMGVDMGGNATDEKIPIHLFTQDIENFLTYGIQTDGSSVVLHEIAVLNNAKLDIIPDLEVNWFIDYNYELLEEETQLPIGTLKIPSFLVHDNKKVDSRSILNRAEKYFKKSTLELLKKHPHLLKNLGLHSVEEIESIELTAATELEFWVKSPEDGADIEKLSTSQTLKEQYWKRTQGIVRTAMEKTILVMEKYGFQPEMGHKEVGGIRSKITGDGKSNHVMEQLEIDWKYSSPIQTGDNELLMRQLVEDIFHGYGLEVTFRAKPIEGVAGSGEHTHVGASLKLKNGKRKNLFAPMDMKEDFLGILGYGALMGILRNYEIVNPFITNTIDAFNRLKPGFEAPVCVVTSLGHSAKEPSRNRSILVGLVRDIENPMSTRFEVRSPNPYSNTYLVMAALYQVMLDGMCAASESRKDNKELEKEISKNPGEESFYLDRNRAYRSEENVFEYYTEQQRNERFGIPPATPWENIQAFESYKDRVQILLKGGVMTEDIIRSVATSTLDRWRKELATRVLDDNMDFIRDCKKLHNEETANDLDQELWERVNALKIELMKSSKQRISILGGIREALKKGDYQTASDLQLVMIEKMEELRNAYTEYRHNLFQVSL
ncbi:glutamine synthetase [Garciella nitratireducens]|uniref:glutamine synthetase n=1 Tax=Garciella nitratireducens DSM 15102 TaxID=1121911 RepID=A0A1T4MI51_9FIRM|nr:glutamine synthetase [Garciella nitratireducens]SJZ66438.1 glutamine synthetase [Garciella nitratireducens DSM 15102]